MCNEIGVGNQGYVGSILRIETEALEFKESGLQGDNALYCSLGQFETREAARCATAATRQQGCASRKIKHQK